jgi:energy-coupling factor transport system permease protein
MALALVPLLYDSPLVLAGALVAAVCAGVAAGVGRELARAAWFAVPLVLLIVIVNPLVYREGETLLIRGGELLGYRIEITLEALAFGGAAGLRLFVLALAFALFSATVDPDDLLRLVRRVSYRSALTASLATRLAPVLARDAFRMSDAARCRPQPPARAAVARATLAGALERAVEVAAALELRGYASAQRPPRYATAWSRHDVRIACAAAAIALTAVATRVAGAGAFEAYPALEVAAGPADVAAVMLLPLLALAPFAGAGARLGVARA